MSNNCTLTIRMRWPNVIGLAEVSRRTNACCAILVCMLGADRLEDIRHDVFAHEIC